MSTTISAARNALYTLLSTAPALAGVQVTFGPPSAYEEQEVVALLGIDTAQEQPETIGNRRNAEKFRLIVGVKAFDPAASVPTTVDARGFALADAVREVVFSNVSLSNSVKWAYPAGMQTEGAVAAEPAGWVIFLRCFVDCESRIT